MTIKKIKDNIFQFSFEEFGSCVYLLKLKKNILIDTSSKENKQEFLDNLKELKIKPEQINLLLLTHKHWDHIENKDLFSNAKIYSLENLKENIPEISEIKIIKTPGHTKDSLCFLYEDILFSGDTLFDNGYIGRTDLPGSEPKEMKKSLKKLEKINYKILCPGHLL
jgi:glyoxylase-like metal-dependent hydrolase (beta-lactamase superfamily II)